MSDAIDLIPMERDDAFGFRIDGKIDKDDITPTLDLLREKLAKHEKMRCYAEIVKLDGITLDALMKDLAFAMKNARRFERMAIVSDRRWLNRLAELEGKLVPGVTVKTFSLDHRDDAMRWLLH